MQSCEELLLPCKNNGRPMTTGKFDTREELITKLKSLIENRGMSTCSAARICGISSATATNLVKLYKINLSLKT